jgi:hypothetical protein
MKYLELSENTIELSAEPGTVLDSSFTITASDKYAEGKIYSSDTRVRLYENEFSGDNVTVYFCVNAANIEAGSAVRGEFTIISNYGEYTVSYRINIQNPQLECSIGHIKNLFHFTNLAQTDWNEAVDIFYSPGFSSILHKNDHNARLSYIGLSKNNGNEQNLEEFLIEVNKKTPITYTFSVEGFLLEDVQDSITRNIVITKSCWGYTNVQVIINGDFVSTDKSVLTNDDFAYNSCDFNIYIDATKLHNGLNSASITFKDACNEYVIPVDILMDDEPQKRTDNRNQKLTFVNMVKLFVDFKYERLSEQQWCDSLEADVNTLLEMDEDSILYNLFRTLVLIKKERFNEAQWYLDMLEQRLSTGIQNLLYACFYLYLTTLVNCDTDYVHDVCVQIENAYANNQDKWELGWFIIHLNENLVHNDDLRWQYMEEMFNRGCTSPLMFCEAVQVLQDNPTFLLKLDEFEENVIWHGARYQMLKQELIEQLQYLAARKTEYSTLLYRILCKVYEINKSPQTIASICHVLILGDRKGADYYRWYSEGVNSSVRVTGLYEYYMMSLEIDKYGDIAKNVEIPKMVLMYFAYQSTLNYELNGFLYAYIIRNRDKYPDLEQSYRIAIERFVVEQIKAGRINENLAYLYQHMLSKQMITDDMAYSYTPLLFMHRIYVDNPNVKNIVVIHEKVNGESLYPVVNNVGMLPIYGSEYKIFLQDEAGNRFTKSIFFENKQLMEPRHQLDYVSGYMQGRLSFDIYLCEVDKKYITIAPDNVKRFKSLVDSPQVVGGFKKEIRTKLLKFYYDNDMIGELDSYLEDVEADEMDAQERAEFIRYLVSRGMFDKAYCWIKAYGLAGVDHKAVARLISKRIVSDDYEYDEFLVNVSYYIYKNMKYDENILRYLLINYEGSSMELRRLWKSAQDIEMESSVIMEKILKQMKYTGINIPDRDRMLIAYSDCQNCNEAIVKDLLLDTAYEYFVNEQVVENEIFNMLYSRYKNGEMSERILKMALLKYWAENVGTDIDVPDDTVRSFVQELISDDIYFKFYINIADIVPELHYVKNCSFVEYRTTPKSRVCIHYAMYDESEKESDLPDESFEIKEMREMYDGIYVSMFQLFYGENIQYYISESRVDDDNIVQEYVTKSDTLYGSTGEPQENGPITSSNKYSDDRFTILNDIMVSINLGDEITAQQLTEEYLCKDFCARELFKVL